MTGRTTRRIWRALVLRLYSERYHASISQNSPYKLAQALDRVHFVYLQRHAESVDSKESLGQRCTAD